MFRRASVFTLAAALVIGAGCARNGREYPTEIQKYALAGGILGAAAGLVYDWAFEGVSAAEGAAIGALGGGLAGALVGDYVSEQNAARAKQEEIERLTKELDALQEKLRASQREAGSLQQDVENLKRREEELSRQVATLTDELNKAKGARVEMTLPNDVLFASGSAVLTDEGKRILDDAAAKIKEAHADKMVQIEGHTDTDPIRQSNWKSNWELGAARALAVLHYLEDRHGVKSEILSASTYSMYRPVASNDTAEGKSRNRRSVIVLYTKWPTN